MSPPRSRRRRSARGSSSTTVCSVAPSFRISWVFSASQVRIFDVVVFLIVHLLVVLIVVNVVALVEVAFVFRVLFVLVGLEILVVREVVISVFTTEVIVGIAVIIHVFIRLMIRITIGLAIMILEGAYAVGVEAFAEAFIVRQPLQPASISVVDIGVDPAEIEVGNQVTISVTVENTGEVAGSQQISVEVDGQALPSQTAKATGTVVPGHSVTAVSPLPTRERRSTTR